MKDKRRLGLGYRMHIPNKPLNMREKLVYRVGRRKARVRLTWPNNQQQAHVRDVILRYAPTAKIVHYGNLYIHCLPTKKLPPYVGPIPN